VKSLVPARSITADLPNVISASQALDTIVFKSSILSLITAAPTQMTFSETIQLKSATSAIPTF
jgi:hypothetical protein